MHKIDFFEDRKNQLLAAARFKETGSYVKTEYAFSLQIEGPLTLAAWVLDTGLEGMRRTIAGKYDVSEGEDGYMLYKENNNYYFVISGQGRTASVSAPVGYLSWEHVTGVYDPGNQTIRLYINGQPMDPEVTNVTSINKVPHVEFFIGNDASLTYPWHGRISDVRVYNRSLTANEIAGLYGSYSVLYEKSLAVSNFFSDLNELAGIWSFNEGEGCIAHDNSGNNNHGIIKNCSPTQWVENRQGKQGRALNFEENNYIEVADSPILQIEDEISISLWLKMPEDPLEQNMTILHKRAAGSKDYSFSLVYYYNEDEDEKGYSWAVSAGAPDQLNQVKLSGAAIPGRWRHIIVTFDGTTKKIYINNKEIAASEGFTINNPGTKSHFFIGRDAGGQSQLSEITIDDLRIYNKILESVERQAIFLDKTNYYLE